GVGVLMSWAFGMLIVAPRAGEQAKQRLLRFFSDPNEDDQVVLANMSAHILGNMASFAQNDEAKELFYPIFDIALDSIDKRWKAIKANVASQRERGVGNFSTSALEESQLFDELKGKLINEFADPLLDAVGFEGESRKVAQAIFLSKFAGNGNTAQGGSTTPGYIGSR
ncbi:MAG: hypothetical protein ACYS30_25300, partial [Planctomycetota bacterium]